MRFLRIGILAISGLLVTGSLARAQIGYDDDVLTIYPTVSFDFDIWNSSPFDYQSYSVISTGYVAWDQAEQALIDVWNDWEYVPYMSTLNAHQPRQLFLFRPRWLPSRGEFEVGLGTAGNSARQQCRLL